MPAVVIYLIIKKVKPLPVLFIGSVLGGVFAIIFQPDIIDQLAPEASNYFEASYVAVNNTLTSNVSIETGNAEISDLLSGGGMSGMLGTVWLIFCAMTFGGVLEATGSLNKITATLLEGIKNNLGLVMHTTFSCVFVI